MRNILSALGFALCAALPSAGMAADPLTVMLDWFVNPDHGPIIVAQTRGYFTDAGLEVTIVAPADPADAPKMVAAGQAEIAVGYQPQLYLQHQAGLPLVRVGTLIDSPLYCVMIDAAGPITGLADLRGKRVGYSVPGIEEALLHSMLRHAGVDPAEVEQINVNFALTPALATGQVDAVSGAFRNFEPHQMADVGKSARCFLPEENGVPAYDELIYLVNPDQLDADATARFLAATARAAREIAADPAAGWRDFAAYAKDLDTPLNRAAWADTVAHFAQDPVHLDSQRYAAFGKFMASAGLIADAPDINAITRDLE